MNNYLETLEKEFQNNVNKEIAIKQMAYMKNHFEFFGIMTTERKQITKPFLVKAYLPPKKDLDKLVKTLWKKPQREFQYFALALLNNYKNDFTEEDISLLEYLIVNKSWWDSIDFIAPNLLGKYLELFPKNRDKKIKEWLASDSLWLK